LFAVQTQRSGRNKRSFTVIKKIELLPVSEIDVVRAWVFARYLAWLASKSSELFKHLKLGPVKAFKIRVFVSLNFLFAL